MVRADADGTAISASAPPAARAADSRRRRATTSRRSKASSDRGRGSSAPRDGRSTMAWAKAGRESAAEAPSADDVERHGPPGGDRQAGLEEGGLHERPRTPLRAAGAWQEERDDPGSRVGRGGRLTGEQRDQRSIERERDAGAIARLPIRPERAAMAERGQTRRGPAAAPDRATDRRRPRRTRRHRRHARSVARTAGRRCDRWVVWSRTRLRGGVGNRPPSIGVSTAAGRGYADVGRGGARRHT